jgi:hypothetical protein
MINLDEFNSEPSIFGFWDVYVGMCIVEIVKEIKMFVLGRYCCLDILALVVCGGGEWLLARAVGKKEKKMENERFLESSDIAPDSFGRGGGGKGVMMMMRRRRRRAKWGQSGGRVGAKRGRVGKVGASGGSVK